MEEDIARYRTVIQWSDEDEVFIASIPALPSCMEDGATREDALQILNVTAGLWIVKARKMVVRYQNQNGN
jgi:predicted RNase H-like HicB family nuclease